MEGILWSECEEKTEELRWDHCWFRCSVELAKQFDVEVLFVSFCLHLLYSHFNFLPSMLVLTGSAAFRNRKSRLCKLQ